MKDILGAGVQKDVHFGCQPAAKAWGRRFPCLPALANGQPFNHPTIQPRLKAAQAVHLAGKQLEVLKGGGAERSVLLDSCAHPGSM